MSECKHATKLKVEGNMAIIYCTKCGKILDVTPVNNSNNNNTTIITNENPFLKDNGGQILHD